jgi:hypothetical protein
MIPETTTHHLTRVEQEAESEAKRLITQIDNALATVALRTNNPDDLVACADRLERAARDLAVALREIARERNNALLS